MACIYIAQGVAGLFKVGMTSSISARRYALKREFLKRGESMAKIIPVADVPDDYARSAEYRVLRLVKELGFKPCSGREWFRGVDFDAVRERAAPAVADAVSWARTMSRRAAALRPIWEKERAEAEAWRKAAKAEREARRYRRQLRQSVSERCFAHIANAALHGIACIDLPRKPSKTEA